MTYPSNKKRHIEAIEGRVIAKKMTHGIKIRGWYLDRMNKLCDNFCHIYSGMDLFVQFS